MSDEFTQFEFEPFQKIGRIKRSCVVTEKIDGTNAQVHILEDGRIRAGSRRRYITPEIDNYGFAKWVAENEEELSRLGPGRHYGEWWGSGIQRRYGLTDDKRFSLFNTLRWSDPAARPECCSTVPVLYGGHQARNRRVDCSTGIHATGGCRRVHACDASSVQDHPRW